MHLERCRIDTPIGTMVFLSQSETLVALSWADTAHRTEHHLKRHFGPLSVTDIRSMPFATGPLLRYLEGEWEALKPVPIQPVGTAFQQRVWAALRTIPVGTTWSYKQLAIAIGKPSACRAVANANGRNPLPVVIPCHRVIAANGELGGFSSGLQRKKWLLTHEQAFTG